MRILYVEDDAQVRETVTFVLRCAGHLVQEAADCSTAQGIIKSTTESFDMLISDIETPGEIDGWALAEAARDCAPALPVIYSTGASLDNARPVANGRILRKPFTTAALLRHVEEAQQARRIMLPLPIDEKVPCLSRDLSGVLPQAHPYVHASMIRTQAAAARARLAAAA